MTLINASKDEVAECAKILSGEGFTVDGGENKRKHAAAAAWRHSSEPMSPSGMIGTVAYFSCESSSRESLSGAWAERSLKRVCPDEENCDAWP